MAKRKLIAQLSPVNCKVVDSLELVTKPGLAMTPKQVQELTDRGIAVSLPNEKSFLDGSPSSPTDWSIDPIFVEMLICVLCGSCPVIVKVEF